MNDIPIYVINLKRVPERKLYIQRQLKALGLEHQFIEAVDAQDFNEHELEGVDLEDKYQPGAMACLLSHVKFYDQMIQNNQQIACVLEDDAYLLPSFAEILDYKRLQKADWEILLLCHASDLTGLLLRLYNKKYTDYIQRNSFYNIYTKFILGSITQGPLKKYIKNHYIAEPYGHSGKLMPKTTTAYLIKLPVAKKLREFALRNKKSVYIDDVTGSTNAFGVPLKVITPPCVRPNLIYFKYSLVYKGGYGEFNHDTNVTMLTKRLPREKLLQMYVRSRWKAIASSILTLNTKLWSCFFSTLIELWKIKIRIYRNPHLKYTNRIRKTKENESTKINPST